MTSSSEWLSTQEAAATLGVTVRTLYKLINDGALPAYKFGRVLRLRENEVRQFIEESRVKPGELLHLVEKGGAEN